MVTGELTNIHFEVTKKVLVSTPDWDFRHFLLHFPLVVFSCSFWNGWRGWLSMAVAISERWQTSKTSTISLRPGTWNVIPKYLEIHNVWLYYSKSTEWSALIIISMRIHIKKFALIYLFRMNNRVLLSVWIICIHVVLCVENIQHFTFRSFSLSL